MQHFTHSLCLLPRRRVDVKPSPEAAEKTILAIRGNLPNSSTVYAEAESRTEMFEQ